MGIYIQALLLKKIKIVGINKIVTKKGKIGLNAFFIPYTSEQIKQITGIIKSNITIPEPVSWIRNGKR